MRDLEQGYTFFGLDIPSQVIFLIIVVALDIGLITSCATLFICFRSTTSFISWLALPSVGDNGLYGSHCGLSPLTRDNMRCHETFWCSRYASELSLRHLRTSQWSNSNKYLLINTNIATSSFIIMNHGLHNLKVLLAMVCLGSIRFFRIFAS